VENFGSTTVSPEHDARLADALIEGASVYPRAMILLVQDVTLCMEFCSGKYRKPAVRDAGLEGPRHVNPPSRKPRVMSPISRKDAHTRRGSGAGPFSPTLNPRAYPTRKRDRASIVVALPVNS
jgi:hypothetical protein